MRRPLTGYERAFCLSQPQVPINFVLVARFRQAPDEIVLRQVLTRLHHRYSMAALRLMQMPDENDTDGEGCFTDEAVPVFPLRVIDGDHDDWHQTAANELGEIFDLAQGPLIRAVLILVHDQSGTEGNPICGDLVLTFHHGIADGMSAVFFLNDLLTLLQDLKAELPCYHPHRIYCRYYLMCWIVPSRCECKSPFRRSLCG